jgi:hypothetical protein
MRRKALLRVLPKVQDKEELLKVQRKEALLKLELQLLKIRHQGMKEPPKERRKKEQPPKRAPKERPSKEVPKKEQLPKVVHLKVMLLKEERPGMPKEVARPMRKLKQILLKGRTPVAPLPKQQQQKVVELW